MHQNGLQWTVIYSLIFHLYCIDLCLTSLCLCLCYVHGVYIYIYQKCAVKKKRKMEVIQAGCHATFNGVQTESFSIWPGMIV